MKLGQKQRLFTHLLAKLVVWVYEEKGYELSYGDAYRDPRVHGEYGEKKSYASRYSKHKLKLAVDFNLFIDGEYQETTEAWREIGEEWESMHELCSWGGHWHDGNHISFDEQTV